MKTQIRAPKAKKLNSYHNKNSKINIEESPFTCVNMPSFIKRKSVPYDQSHNEFFFENHGSEIYEFEENADKLDVIDEVMQIISTPESSEYIGIARCNNTSFEKNFQDEEYIRKPNLNENRDYINCFDIELSTDDSDKKRHKKNSIINRKRGTTKYVKSSNRDKKNLKKAKMNKSSIVITSSIGFIQNAFKSYIDSLKNDNIQEDHNRSQLVLLNRKTNKLGFKLNDLSESLRCSHIDYSENINENFLVSN